METASNLIFRPSRVINNRNLDENTWLLTMRRNFEFIPGQCVAVALDFSITPRLYSIASGNILDHLDILYKVYPDGQLTPKLCNLKKGDPIYLSNPMGTFICDELPAIWIAAGTGIAPFASMAFSGNTANKKLIHGGRTIQSFYFAEHFQQLFGDNYVRCSSREQGNRIFNGRLTGYLSTLPSINPTEMYYLCGSAEMVVETRDILIDKGVSFNKIMAEIYF